jgi:uncharacterized protein YjbI with pentapeptide repeats
MQSQILALFWRFQPFLWEKSVKILLKISLAWEENYLCTKALTKCNFQKARISEAEFDYADLRLTNFNGATVIKCDFTGADLTGSQWKKVRHVEKCIWKDVKGISSEYFPSDLLNEIRRQNAK